MSAPLIRSLAPRTLFALLALFAFASTSLGQGLLVHIDPHHPHPLPRPFPRPTPQPEGQYRIDELAVNARIEDQVARVQVSQTFENVGSRQMEVSFVFPLPYDGAVDQMTLLVDGKEYPAKLLPAKEARKLYEDIVRTNKDPALLEWMGTGLFKTSVFPVPAGAKRTVTMRYTQVCRQSQGLVDFLFPLRTARYTCDAPQKISVNVSIESSQPMKNVYCASHPVTIERTDDTHATVKYESTKEIPSADFRLFYDASTDGLGASVVSYRPDPKEPGYFLLMASPDLDSNNKLQAKTVVLVADTSGSMSGEKIDQTKAALKYVVNNLNQDDTFNIVTYDSQVMTFAPELQKVNDESIKKAIGYIDGLFAGGSTNIAGALERTFKMLNDDDQPTYVVFMTDGIPTTGETNEMKIAELVAPLNEVRARVISMGVGYDVNSRLLDRLSSDNYGRSEYVRPNEDIERVVKLVYSRLSAPVLVDVTVDAEFDENISGPAIQRLYPDGPFDLFRDDTAIVVGRYRADGTAKITIKGKLQGKEKTFAFPAEFASDSKDDTNSFVAKLWATRRVGEIIDELDLKGENDELVKELVELATKHGILTQYTSFMADDTARPSDIAANASRARGALRQLELADGEFGFNQRAAKQFYGRAGNDGIALGGGSRPSATPASGPESERLKEESAELSRLSSFGNATWYDAKNDKAQVAENIVQIGRKTFFNQNGQWIDSSLDADEVKNARNVEQFSDEYFELASKHGRYANGVLAMGGRVVVRLGDEVVSW